MRSAHPIQVSYPTPLHVHTSSAPSTRGPILLKFKTFIQFIIEDLGHDLDCSVTGKSLIFVFSLSSFLPFLLPFLSSSGLKKKINIKKAAVVCRRLGHLGDLSSSSRALWTKTCYFTVVSTFKQWLGLETVLGTWKSCKHENFHLSISQGMPEVLQLGYLMDQTLFRLKPGAAFLEKLQGWECPVYPSLVWARCVPVS